MATHNLAGLYLDGLGVETSQATALTLYKEAMDYAEKIPGVPDQLRTNIQKILDKLENSVNS